MSTYPVTPTSNTLANDVVGAILRNYRDGGFVQGTAVVRDVNKTNQYDSRRELSRKFDFKTATFVDVSGVAATPATADVVQLVPVDAGDVILSGSLRVIRAASAGGSATATVQIGSTALSSAINLLATGTTPFNTACPIAVGASADTVDLLLTGTTSPVFDALVELVLSNQPNEG